MMFISEVQGIFLEPLRANTSYWSSGAARLVRGDHDDVIVQIDR